MVNKIVGIYLIQIDKYNYVGQSIDVKGRIGKHKYKLKLGKHENSYMQNVYNKYKNFSYKILWEGSVECLQLMEQRYINWLGNSLNIREASNNIMTKRHKKSISKAHKKSKLVQASVIKAKEARITNGVFLSEERKNKNRSRLPTKKYYGNTTNFCLQKKGEVFIGNQYEFCMYTGISHRSFNQVINHRQSNTYGWHLYAVAFNKPG